MGGVRRVGRLCGSTVCTSCSAHPKKRAVTVGPRQNKKQVLRFLWEQGEGRMEECRFLPFPSVGSVFPTDVSGVRTLSLLFATAVPAWKQVSQENWRASSFPHSMARWGTCTSSHGAAVIPWLGGLPFPSITQPICKILVDTKWC